MDASAPAHAPVLVVDDDDDIREAIRVAAEASGYRVDEAATIGEACRFLRAATSRYVVLLDFFLPVENADALLRLLADDEALRCHCYILMPANPPTWFSHEAQCLIAQWCSEVLMKPFDLVTLFTCIERAETPLACSQ